MASDTYGNRLNVAFSDYISRVEAGTGKPVVGEELEALAMNYALEAAKAVTAQITKNSRKLNKKTSRPTEYSIAKRRIDASWAEMTNSFATFPSNRFKEGLIKLLKDLSTPTEAELVNSEVVGDKKMIHRTTSDYKEILVFLESAI